MYTKTWRLLENRNLLHLGLQNVRMWNSQIRKDFCLVKRVSGCKTATIQNQNEISKRTRDQTKQTPTKEKLVLRGLGHFSHIWHLQWGFYSQSQFMVSWWFIGVYPHFQLYGDHQTLCESWDNYNGITCETTGYLKTWPVSETTGNGTSSGNLKTWPVSFVKYWPGLY